MAVTTINYSPPITQLPIQGVGTLPQSLTAIPQHALLFEGTEQMAADGNQLSIVATYELPRGYVYTLTDFEASIQAIATADLAYWESVLDLLVRYVNRSDQILTHRVPMNSWGAQLADGTYFHSRSYVPERLPSYPIFPSQEAGVNQIEVTALSQSPPTSDCEYHTFARFLAFDQQQFENFPLHTPTISIR